MEKSDIIFFAYLKANGIELPTPEHKFHKTRKWRFDYAWTSQRIALEVEGGVWTQGRHTRGAGFLGDMEKYNEATLIGWRILRITPSEKLTDKTINLLKRIL